MILEPKKIKVCHCFHCFPSICHEVMGPDAMILVFLMLNFKPVFSLCSFTFIKRLFSSSPLSAIRVVSSAYLRLLIFLLASPGGSDGKESACNAGDLGLIPGLGRSLGRGNSYPLQYSGLENSMDHGVAKSQTRLRDFHFTSILIPVCASSSLAFFMLYSAYKLNNQHNDI